MVLALNSEHFIHGYLFWYLVHIELACFVTSEGE